MPQAPKHRKDLPQPDCPSEILLRDCLTFIIHTIIYHRNQRHLLQANLTQSVRTSTTGPEVTPWEFFLHKTINCLRQSIIFQIFNWLFIWLACPVVQTTLSLGACPVIWNDDSKTEALWVGSKSRLANLSNRTARFRSVRPRSNHRPSSVTSTYTWTANCQWSNTYPKCLLLSHFARSVGELAAK